MPEVKVKDPSEVLDWTFDWTADGWLTGSEVISTSTWSVSPSGLTIDSETETTTTSTVWLSGGTRRQIYEVTNTIVTNSTPARTGQRTITIRVSER